MIRPSIAENTGRIVILAGPPGAGKSTIARRLASDASHGVHLHTDDFWHFILAGSIPPFEPAADPQNQTVIAAIAACAQTYADGGYLTVVDGVVGPWMLHHFAASRPTYIVLRPRREVALARAQARKAPDALVDAAPITALWDQFADLGELEAHALDTSDEPSTRTLRRVVEAAAHPGFTLGGSDEDDAPGQQGAAPRSPE